MAFLDCFGISFSEFREILPKLAMAICVCFISVMSFSEKFEFPWVTKRKMAAAAKNSLSAVEKNLIERIQNLDDKMEAQIEISKNLHESVEEIRKNSPKIEYALDAVRKEASSLKEKLRSLKYQQDIFFLDLAKFVGIELSKELQERLSLAVPPVKC